jgi:hypothetical protein
VRDRVKCAIHVISLRALCRVPRGERGGDGKTRGEDHLHRRASGIINPFIYCLLCRSPVTEKYIYSAQACLRYYNPFIYYTLSIPVGQLSHQAYLLCTGLPQALLTFSYTVPCLPFTVGHLAQRSIFTLPRLASGINPFIYCTLSIPVGQLSQQAYLLCPDVPQLLALSFTLSHYRGVTCLSAAFIKIKANLHCLDVPQVS